MDKKILQKKYLFLQYFLVEHRGFEPLTSTLPVLRAPNCANAPWYVGMKVWWAIKGSNLGPTGYEPVALTN